MRWMLKKSEQKCQTTKNLKIQHIYTHYIHSMDRFKILSSLGIILSLLIKNQVGLIVQELEFLHKTISICTSTLHQSAQSFMSKKVDPIEELCMNDYQLTVKIMQYQVQSWILGLSVHLASPSFPFFVFVLPSFPVKLFH